MAAAIRLAASSPGRRSAAPPSRITQPPAAVAWAASSITGPGTTDGGRDGTGGAGPAPSDHDTSAGRISVATPPGGPRAAATPSAASAATSALRAVRRTQRDTVRASESMSDSSGASNRLWLSA